MKHSKLFPCYSVPLMKFITSKGIGYELVALNPKTKKKFWIYVKNDLLNKYLTEWKETAEK